MLKLISVYIIIGHSFTDNIQADQRTSYKKCHEIYFNESASQILVRSIQHHHRVARDSDLNLTKLRTSSGEFPYMVAIGFENDDGTYTYQCGGILISPDYILTSGTCTFSPQNDQSPAIVARIGGLPIDDDSHPGANILIDRIHVHPQFQKGFAYNDIALLKLKKPSTQTQPACLWQTNEIDFSDGIALRYYGESAPFSGERKRELLKIDLNFYSNEECNGSYAYFDEMRLKDGIKESQVCLGDRSGTRDTCQGEYGDPIVVKIHENDKEIPYVVGIITFGQFCGSLVPFVFTRVSSYLDWIESIVWQ